MATRRQTTSLDPQIAPGYLDPAALQSIGTAEFRDAHPFPWINADGLIAEDSYQTLLQSLPEPEKFKQSFGRRRRHGQESHDRFVLNYSHKLDLPAPWRAFVDELQGPAYSAFIRRLLDIEKFSLSFHWHYTPRGCALSPHCDAEWKYGSHVFYFNTTEDWDPAWGGQTLILDDGGEFSHKSAPKIEDFKAVIPSSGIGNSSLLFKRTDRSWHGMYPLASPAGALRKVFIVEIRKSDLATRLQTLFH